MSITCRSVARIKKNLSNVFHNLLSVEVGLHWWPNLRIAHLSFTQTADLPSAVEILLSHFSLHQMHILMHIAAHQIQMQIGPVAHFKSYRLSRFAFSSTTSKLQVPIKIFSLNHVIAVLEYLSTHLQDCIWFCFKVPQLEEIILQNFMCLKKLCIEFFPPDTIIICSKRIVPQFKVLDHFLIKCQISAEKCTLVWDH